MTDARKETTVVIGGVEHTLLLDSEDADRYGDAKAQAPQNKSRAASGK